MSPSQVEALESGDYARLPKGTFLRGFVRNYAKLVGVEAEPLIAGLAQTTPGDASPRIVVPSQNIRFEPLHERISSSPYTKGGLIAGVVLALGFAAMYWWIAIRPSSPPPTQAAAPATPTAPKAQQIAVAPLPAAESPPPLEAPSVEAAPAPAVALPQPAPAKAANAPPAAAKPTPAAPAPAKSATPKADAANATAKAEGAAVAPVAAKPQSKRSGATEGRIRLRFRGESWVEIRDAEGKVLISRLNAAGSEAGVTGKPPFTVIVGNAPDVTMLYNDREFPLEPHTKVAVARFTVE